MRDSHQVQKIGRRLLQSAHPRIAPCRDGCAVQWKSVAHSQNFFVVQRFKGILTYFYRKDFALVMLCSVANQNLIPTPNPLPKTSQSVHPVIPHARVIGITLVLRDCAFGIMAQYHFRDASLGPHFQLFCMPLILDDISIPRGV